MRWGAAEARISLSDYRMVIYALALILIRSAATGTIRRPRDLGLSPQSWQFWRSKSAVSTPSGARMSETPTSRKKQSREAAKARSQTRRKSEQENSIPPPTAGPATLVAASKRGPAVPSRKAISCAETREPKEKSLDFNLHFAIFNLQSPVSLSSSRSHLRALRGSSSMTDVLPYSSAHPTNNAACSTRRESPSPSADSRQCRISISRFPPEASMA